MLIKECPALVKAAPDDNGTGQGQFTAIVSVFGNEDSVGDVVIPGAFTQTLAGWKASGNPIPVIWSHDWSDPFSHIGYVLDAEELQPGDNRLPDNLKTNGGLLVTGQLDTDNPKAVQVYRLLKGNRVTQFSFAYDIEEGALVEDENGIHYELRVLKLHEVGPCLVGANQETELLAVKANNLAAGVKEGRVLAAKHVTKLKDAHAALGEVITAAEAVADAAKTRGAKAASGSTDLPLDGEQDHAWDADAAQGRILSWAGGGDDLSDMDWSKYREAYFWYDSANAEQAGSYKLPFADVIDGKLTAIWHGVTACAAVINGSRGGVDIPDADVAAVKSRIGKYYAKAAEQFDDDSITVPWGDDTKTSAADADAGQAPGAKQDASRPGSEPEAAAEAAVSAGKSGAANGPNPERVRMLADLDSIEFGLAETN